MHAGLETYHKYLTSIRRADDPESVWSVEKMHEIMREFERVLFKHMDAEVESIGADSLRRSGMTLKELSSLPI